jgi:chromosome segregation ATPase
MQWFEYDKAEEQLEILAGHLSQAQSDLITYKEQLSPISIQAIKNEIVRLDMYMKDIQDMLDSPVSS